MTYRLVRCLKCGKEHKTKFYRFRCCGVLQNVTKENITLESAEKLIITDDKFEKVKFNSCETKAFKGDILKPILNNKSKIIPTKKEVNKNGEFRIDKRRISATYGKSKEETITATST